MTKILLVEDDPMIINLYKIKFSLSGMNVLTANDGLAALELVKKELPDVLLLDVLIPGKSGLEIMKELKSDPVFSKIKIVALTNLDDENTKKQVADLGVEKYIVKANFTPQQVVDTVKDLIKT